MEDVGTYRLKRSVAASSLVERKCNNEQHNERFNRERQVISSFKAHVMHTMSYYLAIVRNYFPLENVKLPLR